MDKAVHDGLKKAGIETRVDVAVEKERKYLDISIDRHPELFDSESLLIEASIEDLDLSSAPECDIVVAVLPCTGASISGRSKNRLAHAEDHAEAGSLFYFFLNWVQASEPTIVIIENVKQYASTASMSAIRGVLKSFGYSVQERVLNGNDFGALENRDRLCVVAISNGLSDVFELETILPLHAKYERLAEVLDPVPLDSDQWRDYSYLAAKEIRDKESGKGFHHQLFSPDDTRISTITRRYNKGGSTDPFIVHPEAPLLSRKINRNEHARMKGIPESFVAGDEVSETVAHEVMGQSVIPFAFESVGFGLGCDLVSAFSDRELSEVA
jgi:DNA (cytosine-5)-methyltransferase 1